MFDFFYDLISNTILMYPTSYSKLRNNIEDLSKEHWFKELYSDPKYNNLIWKNKKIKVYLLNKKNISSLKNSKEEQLKFINLLEKS
ncbi:hypothetical protein [Priestia flexa]|uniref:hypothetical protein n=1 Tax=Priestia flexa TaxID=86664 RepID=UPI002491D0F2|nr:hypothetical protein [Priestia flexa]